MPFKLVRERWQDNDRRREVCDIRRWVNQPDVSLRRTYQFRPRRQQLTGVDYSARRPVWTATPTKRDNTGRAANLVDDLSLRHHRDENIRRIGYPQSNLFVMAT